MPILDTAIYRLKPEAGDSSPHNEIGGGDVLTGGTISLVDLGGGDYVWQFSGSDSSVTGPSKVLTVANATGGFTMAVKMKVATQATVDFTRLLQFQKASDSNIYLGFRRDGSNSTGIRYNPSSGASLTQGSAGASWHTYVIRVKTNGASNDSFEIWRDTGSIGTRSPDQSSTNIGSVDNTWSKLLVGGQNSAVIQVKDWIIFSDEKTDAECSAMVEDLRGTVDGATVTLDIDCAETSDTVSVAVDVAVELDVGYTETNDTVAVAVTVDGSPVELDIDVAETSDTVLCTVDVVNPSVDVDVGYTEASDTVSVALSVGTVLVTRIFKNNTGTARASVSGVKLAIYDATTKALVAHLTGLTTDSNGRLTVSHVDIVSGTTYAYEADFTVAGFGRRLPTAVAA